MGAIGGLMSGLMGMGGGGGGGIGSIIGSMFGGVAGAGQSFGGQQQQQQQMPMQMQQMQQPMRGPTNVDDILKELANSDRIEMVSTISESEMSEMVDDASLNGAGAGAFVTPKNVKGRRTLNL